MLLYIYGGKKACVPSFCILLHVCKCYSYYITVSSNQGWLRSPFSLIAKSYAQADAISNLIYNDCLLPQIGSLFLLRSGPGGDRQQLQLFVPLQSRTF